MVTESLKKRHELYAKVRKMVFRRFRIVSKNTYYISHVLPSVQTHQHGDQWTELREI